MGRVRLLRPDERAVQNPVNVRSFFAEGEIAARVIGARECSDRVHCSLSIGEKIEFAARFPSVTGKNLRRLQRKIIVDCRSSLLENAVEDVAHRENGWPCIDPNAARLHFAHLAARPVVFLQDGYAAALRGKFNGSRQATDTRSGYDNALFPQGKFS